MSDKEKPLGLKKTRKGCRCSGSSNVTILNIGGRNEGIKGIKQIFEDLEDKGISPDEVDEEEFIGKFKEDNYISRKKED
ncbi:MAG: hypothetical protein ACOC85_05815 [Thermoplasmatota archaeon]